MTVGELIVALERIATGLSASEDKEAIALTIAVLIPHTTLSIAELTAAMGAIKSRKTTAPKPTLPKKPTAPTTDFSVVSHYVAALENEASDGAATQRILNEMKSDKKVRIGEVGAILSRVRGSEVKVVRKAEGLKTIERWFQRKRDTSRRISDADEIY